MVYKRVRGWTTGRNLPVLNFVKYPPGSTDIIYSKKRTVFRERSSEKTVSFEELTGDVQGQISEHIFPPNGLEAVVLIILQIFFATHVVLKLGSITWILPSFSWGIFGDVMRLEHERPKTWVIRAVGYNESKRSTSDHTNSITVDQLTHR